MRTSIDQPYKRQDKWYIVALSLIILVPLGIVVMVLSVLLFPFGLLMLPVGFILVGGAFSPLIKTSICACPHCNNPIRVARNTKIFKCSHCKRKVSNIGEMLEGI